MKSTRITISLVCLSLFLLCILPGTAQAYIGPGTGLTAVGAFLALVVGVFVAIFGFVWYPVKRYLRKKKQRPGGEGGVGE